MIFIVDDDPSVRTSLTRLLRSEGYEARAFADAAEYLQHADAAGPPAGCVILDLHMPGMGGLELQEVINRRVPRVPVIVLTASDDSELRTRALLAGATQVLRKPCDSAVLLRAIATAIGQPPPSQTAGPPTHTTARTGEPGGRVTAPGNPDRFVLEDGRAFYRPVGTVSFDEAAALVRAGIAAARRNRVKSLLVNTTGLIGFPSPDTLERFLAVVQWAEEARSGLRLAMVARAEMIHPQKFGVIVAANRGLASNVFTTEVEARDWLAALDDQ